MQKKRNLVKLFKWEFDFKEHLYVEIANIPSCSTFGYTNRSEKIKMSLSIKYPLKSGTRNFIQNTCKV